jgi:hypothetical protein
VARYGRSVPTALVPDDEVIDALRRQSVSCEHLGSPVWGSVLRGLADRADERSADGARIAVLVHRLGELSTRPIHDAVPLRLLGALHRLALAGRAPRLARHLASCGGSWLGDDLTSDVLDAIDDRPDDIELGLRRNVQTNEVGRAAVLAAGFSEIARRTTLPLRTLEVGASAGLLSCWDRFSFETGATRTGDPTAAMRFDASWYVPPVPLLEPNAIVIDRAASDIAPFDPTDPEQRLTMLSFVWPDQVERRERLLLALEVLGRIRAEEGFVVDQADAGTWATERLAEPVAGTATVVFHTIVWQYLPEGTRARLRAAIARRAATATPDAPVAWMRMEPATPNHADLRLDWWDGHSDRSDHVLAEVGYHGRGVRWINDGD